jgi:hypothetical protein
LPDPFIIVGFQNSVNVGAPPLQILQLADYPPLSKTGDTTIWLLKSNGWGIIKSTCVGHSRTAMDIKLFDAFSIISKKILAFDPKSDILIDIENIKKLYSQEKQTILDHNTALQQILIKMG